MNSYINTVTCPYLGIHLTKDIVSKAKAIIKIEKKVKSKVTKTIIITEKRHNPFMLPSKKEVFKDLGDFFDHQKVFNSE